MIRRLAFVAPLILAIPVLADTIVVGSGAGASTLTLKDVKIQKIEGEKLFFRSQGNETSRDLTKIQQLTVDDEPNLNAAEAALVGGQNDKAIDAYQKTIKSTSKDWVKDWSAIRLIAVANKANRFDAATTAYVQLLNSDPNAASKNKPTVPKEKTPALDAAEKEVNRGLSNSKLNDTQKNALNAFLLEIQLAKGDTAAAGKTAEKIGGGSSSSGTPAPAVGGGEAEKGGGGGAAPAQAVPDNATARAALAQGKLATAKLALQQKQYDKVVKEINDNRELFTEAPDQAEALFLLAEGRAGQAEGGDDPQKLKDAAIEYMRVVAHFKDAAGAPHVAESLFKTAQILEKLKDPKTATETYQQVAAQYPDSPVAAQAKESAERLKKAQEQ